MVAAVESARSNRTTTATIAAEMAPTSNVNVAEAQQPGDATAKSWAERASSVAAAINHDGHSPDGFTTVSYKRRRPTPKVSVKLTGKRAANENVKTVQRRLIPVHVSKMTYRPLSEMDFVSPRQKKKEIDARAVVSAELSAEVTTPTVKRQKVEPLPRRTSTVTSSTTTPSTC